MLWQGNYSNLGILTFAINTSVLYSVFFSHICLLFSFLSFPSIFNTNFKHIPINREDNIMNPYVPINHLQQWSFCQPGFDYSLLLSLLNILRKLISFLPHQNKLYLYVCLLFIFASSNRRTYKGFNMVSEKKIINGKLLFWNSLSSFSLYTLTSCSTRLTSWKKLEK